MQAETQHTADWWARPRGATAAEWVANYQHSLDAPHRVALSGILDELGAEDLLEVGCHCGPNLMRFAAERPGFRMIGIDASAEAIDAGRQWAVARGVSDRVRLSVGRLPEALYALHSGTFDVVLSCYALAYFAPQDLGTVLYEIGRLASRAVIIAEPMAIGEMAEGRHGSLTGYQEWRHDYRDRMKWIGSLADADVDVRPLEPPVDRLNGILVCKKKTT